MSKYIPTTVSCIICKHVFSPRWFEGHKCSKKGK